MVETRGSIGSPEVILYQPTNESSMVFEYRHKLMERFVEVIELQSYAKVAGTKIFHLMRFKEEVSGPVMFEFTVTGMGDDFQARYTVQLKGKLEAVVDRLADALEAEHRLQMAQEDVTRNSF